MVPDLVLAVAEKLAAEEGKRVLVLLTDMTAYADAMKEIGISMERIPSNRGYMGDLYSQLARRYEKACDFKGAGSVTILSVTTMPGGDVTHPVPDNTGYITEGQFYLHNGVLDPFGSLSRLKQHVIGKETREDHGQIMNTMIYYYSEGVEAEQKQAMAFDLSEFDKKLLKFSRAFREQFMHLDVSMKLEDGLDACWNLLSRCFDKDEVIIKKELKIKYWTESNGQASAK
jgi:V/A-type H+-transporting ATPase subunit B